MKLSIKAKTVLLFLFLGLLPLVVVAVVGYSRAREGLAESAFEKFKAIQSLKEVQVEELFLKFHEDVEILSKSADMQNIVTHLRELRNSGNSDVKSEQYRSILDKYGMYVAKFTDNYDYHDLFVIDSESGDVLFTVRREADLGASLKTGPYKNEGLADVWRSATSSEDVAIADFSFYSPSGGEQAAFVATRIEGADAVVALQIPVEKINKIVHNRRGLGESGETYLVGRVDGKTSYRSDRQLKNGKIGDKRSDEFTKLALEGKNGHGFKVGSTGLRELVAYEPVNIKGLSWGIISTISEEEALAYAFELRNIFWTLALVVSALVLVIVILLSKKFNRGLTFTMEKFEMIGEGDLTVRFDYLKEDELGKLASGFNGFMEKLHNLMTTVKHSSERVGGSSGEVASGNNQLSSATQEMASSLEETAASVEEITASIRETTEKGALVAHEMTLTARDAGKGAEMLSKMQEATGELKTSGERIKEIVDVVNDIAFQTNLLALNAAVEAARAGEEGKGFAVVAGEVRNLAARSGTAVREIKSLVEQNDERIFEAGRFTEETVEKLTAVVNRVREGAESVMEMEERLKEQSSGIEQINRAVMQMEEVTQQNASLVEELASAAEEMKHVSDELTDEVSFFKVGETGMNPLRKRAVVRKPNSQARKMEPKKEPVKISSEAETAFFDDSQFEEF